MSNLAKWGYKAGTSGTVIIPVGAIVTHIRAASADSAGALQIFGGESIPIDGDPTFAVFELPFGSASDFKTNDPKNALHGAPESKFGAQTIVFTSTVSYFVAFLYKAQTFARTSADTMAINDAVSRASDAARAKSDTMSVSDSIASLLT